MTLDPCNADPILTASIYCNRRLDYLIRDAIAPFWRDLEAASPARNPGLWFMRYGKCGEHVKLRIHGTEEFAAAARKSLPGFLDDFFARPISDPLPDLWISKSGIPAIDREDESEEDYPNKSLLWTTYQRSPINLGCMLYAEDDEHVRRYAACQCVVARQMMEEITPALDREGFFSFRQNQFFKLLIGGLATTDLNTERWLEYQTYHRDWLIRFLVANVAPASTKAETILAQFAPRIARMDRGITILADLITAASHRPLEDSTSAEQPSDWTRAVGEFFDYVVTYRGRPEYDQDPYTDDHTFLPLFKVFHGAANQFGLRLSNEAYMHHVLCIATEQALDQAHQKSPAMAEGSP